MKTVTLFILFFCSLNVIGAPKEIALQYDSSLVNQGFASPIVTISINGKNGRFLVDSGASITVVSQLFAEKAKVVISGQGDIGGSSGGFSQSAVGKADLIVRSSLGKASFKGHHVVIVSLPNVFRENDLDGILSPQQLLNDREIGILDLSEMPSFKIYNDPPDLSKTAFGLNVISSSGPGGSKTTLFTIEAFVADTKTTFIVDTGADGAGLGVETLVGKKLLPMSIPTNEKIGGINGTPAEIRLVPHASVRLLGRKFDMNIRLQPTSQGMPADGMLGMQFLKNCRLLLSSTRGSIHCP